MSWIPNVRGLIRETTAECLRCKKLDAKRTPVFIAGIPEERLEYNTNPFNNTSIDYFGPFLVNYDNVPHQILLTQKDAMLYLHV